MLIVDRITSISLWSKIFRAILAQHLYLYLAQHSAFESEFAFFLSSFLDYLLSPYSTQTSFIKVLLGNKFSVYFSVPIQINHEKNLQIFVLRHHYKCEICSKWCKHEIYSKLTIKTPFLLFWCLIVNVCVITCRLR